MSEAGSRWKYSKPLIVEILLTALSEIICIPNPIYAYLLNAFKGTMKANATFFYLEN